MRWPVKGLMAKVETTYGTDAVPTGAANAILAKNVQISPMEGEDVDRNLEMPWLGASQQIPVGLHQRISFEVDLTGSGAAGTAPAFGVLLRGCALAATTVAGTSVTYSPITNGIESLSIYLNIDGAQFVLLGSQGTCELQLDAKGLPVLRFTFWGLWQQATDTALVAHSIASQIARVPQPGSSANTPTFTINSVPLALRSFRLDMGVKVEPRMLIRKESIIITDRQERISATVEAVAFATLNPIGLARAGTLVPLSLVHGTGAGNIITLSVPAMQLMRLSGLEQNQDVVEWPLQGVPIPQTGNDQFTLAFT